MAFPHSPMSFVLLTSVRQVRVSHRFMSVIVFITNAEV